MAKTAQPIADNLPTAAEARQELARGIRVFKAFEHADKALAVLENLEQLTRERQGAADAAQAAADAARAELASASADVGAAKDEAKRLRADARTKAAELVTKAEQDAKAATTEAERRCAALRGEADALVALMLEKQNELAELEPALVDARATIAKAKEKGALLAAD